MPPLLAWAFAKRLLHEAGWPRKLGRFKGEGYDMRMVDLAIAEAMTWGAALGAERPSLALQMIAEMYDDRDWEGEDAPNVKVYVEELRENTESPWNTAASPQEAVHLQPWADIGAALSVEQFDRRDFRVTLDTLLFRALTWGLEHPDRLEAWYSAQKAGDESVLPLATEAGVELDGGLPSLAEFVEAGEQVIRDYEQFGKKSELAPVPPRLLADAEALGWRV